MITIRDIWFWIAYPFKVAWLILWVFGGAFMYWVRGWGFADSAQRRVQILEEEHEAEMAPLRKRRRELVREAYAVAREFDDQAKKTRAEMEADLQKAIDDGDVGNEDYIRRQLNMLKDMEHRQRLQTSWMNKKENP